MNRPSSTEKNAASKEAIAQKTAKEIKDKFDGEYLNTNKLTSIIRSAIDKANQWLEWRELLHDGRPRALCWKCGYPELIGSDDCRNCQTNFYPRIEVNTEGKQPQRRDTLRESLTDKGIDCDKVVRSDQPNELPTESPAQPQEWTKEFVQKMFEANFADDTVAAIVAAHNATLKP